jgi:hypothetical protein
MPAVIGLHNFASQPTAAAAAAAAAAHATVGRGVLRRIARRRKLDARGELAAAGTLRAGSAASTPARASNAARKLSPIIRHSGAAAARQPLSPLVMKSSANRADVVHGTPPKSRQTKAAAPQAKLTSSQQDENAIDAFLQEIDRLQQQQQQHPQSGPNVVAVRTAASSLASAPKDCDTPPRNSKAYRDRRSELVGLIRELVIEHDEPLAAPAPASSSAPQTPRSRAKQLAKLQKDSTRLEQFG